MKTFKGTAAVVTFAEPDFILPSYLPTNFFFI